VIIKSAYQNLIPLKDYPANRAYPLAIAIEAVIAAANVHEPFFAAVPGGEGFGTYQLPAGKLCGTYRAGLGVAGGTFDIRFYVWLIPGVLPAGENTQFDKEGEP